MKPTKDGIRLNKEKGIKMTAKKTSGETVKSVQKTEAKKAPAKKAPAKKAPAKKAPAKKAPAKKAPAKKAVAQNVELSAKKPDAKIDAATAVEVAPDRDATLSNPQVTKPQIIATEPAKVAVSSPISQVTNTATTSGETPVLSDRARTLMCIKRRKRCSPMVAFRNKLNAACRTVKKIAATLFML